MLVVNKSGKIEFFLFPFAPKNVVYRDRFGCPDPGQCVKIRIGYDEIMQNGLSNRPQTSANRFGETVEKQTAKWYGHTVRRNGTMTPSTETVRRTDRETVLGIRSEGLYKRPDETVLHYP